MIRRSIIFIAVSFCCWFVPNLVYAQIGKTKVKLLDGSKLRGEVFENRVEEFITLSMMDSLKVTIGYENIKWIKGNTYTYHPFKVKDSGYFNYTSFGLIFLKSNEFSAMHPDWTFHTVNGIRFHPRLRAGIGLGIDRYGESSALPIYLSGRADLLTTRITPVVNLNVGYAPMWIKKSQVEWGDLESVSGGFYWEVGAGVEFHYTKTVLILNLGYKQQSADLEYSNVWWWWGGASGEDAEEHRTFKNIAFTIGLEF